MQHSTLITFPLFLATYQPYQGPPLAMAAMAELRTNRSTYTRIHSLDRRNMSRYCRPLLRTKSSQCRLQKKKLRWRRPHKLQQSSHGGGGNRYRFLASRREAAKCATIYCSRSGFLEYFCYCRQIFFRPTRVHLRRLLPRLPKRVVASL